MLRRLLREDLRRPPAGVPQNSNPLKPDAMSRRSSRTRSKSPAPAPAPAPARRVSSRATKYSASMTDPDPPPSSPGPGPRAGRRAAAAPPPPSPIKSPAVRRRARRRTVRTEMAVVYEEDSDDDADLMESSSESEDDGPGDGGDSDGGGGDGSGDEEAEEVKMQRILASRSMTRARWREVCRKMNTSEVDNGSRWFQDGAEGDDGGADGAAADDGVFEERFLVKWAGLSFLHCSWETQDDLVAQVDNAKTYLTTFFRRAENGLLFDADERGDGEYYDPGYVQIERVLEILDPEEDEDEDGDDEEEQERGEGRATRGDKGGAGAAGGEAATSVEKYGIVLDRDDPNFEEGTGRQFLIKWGSTPYSDSSYEFERDLILNDVEYEEHVAAFLSRSAKPVRSVMTRAFARQEEARRRLYKIFGDRAKGSEGEKAGRIAEYQRKIEGHVFANGGRVRDYQAEGVSWLLANNVNDRSSILADEMGLGKTIQTAVYINTLATELGLRGPFLIVAPLSTIPHWYREFTAWTDLNTCVYHGSAKDREYIREFEMAYETDRPTNVSFNAHFLQKCHRRGAARWERTWMTQVVITTPEMLVTEDFLELTAVQWEVLVVDEAHRLKNHTSKLASNLRHERFHFGSTLLLTGTPIQNNMNEMWTLLNIVDPDKFDDVGEFLEKYGDMKSKERVDELHESIRPYILRRLKEDVEKSVPPKEETLIEVELTVLQKQYYRALYEKNVQFLHRNQKKALDGPSINNLAMQLRKCCNHPFLLRGVEEELRVSEDVPQDDKKGEENFLVKASGKLVLLSKLLPKLRADGHRVLIFSQFKIMLDILEDYLDLGGFKHERIDGSITGKKRQMAIDRFQTDPKEGEESSFVMLLSTRAGGVGINLTAADTCIIFDSDWNPQNDLQAQARCHRIGQTKSVKVYRLLSRKTYEMQMFHQSSLKMGLDQAVLQGFEGGSANGEGVLSKEEVEQLLRHGAYDLFNEEKSGASEKESNDFESQDIDSIMARRAKTVVHDNTGSKSSAVGGTFSKASFKAAKNEGDGGRNGDGNNTEDVDIDDPDFWKKMVGEAQVEEKDNLAGKKRKRRNANYSERDYERKLNMSLKVGGHLSSDDDTSVTSIESNSDLSDDDDDDFEFGQMPLANKVLCRIRDERKELNPKREKQRWGAKGTTDWARVDVETVLTNLQISGYGNFPWEERFGKIAFSKEGGYPAEEVKRMCWSLVLFSLREVVDDDVREVARRAQRAAEKKRESEDGAPPPTDDGGVLGSATEPTVAEKARKEEQIDISFRKCWDANSSWASKALEDAIEYAKAHSPRKEEQIQELLDTHKSHGDKSEKKKPTPPLTAAFNKNIWSALNSRGWRDEPIFDSERANQFVTPPKRYIYKGRTYKNVSGVLDIAPKEHPELADTIQSIISAVSNDTSASLAEAKKADSDVFNVLTKLNSSTITADSLNTLLRHCSPSQLLVDRTKDGRIKMGRRMLLLLTYLNSAHSLVSRAKAAAGVSNTVSPNGDIQQPTDHSRETINELSKLISLDKRTSLPHPNWKSTHDAVLVLAIAKHGWVDRDYSCRAINEDKTIKWGPPFDDGGIDNTHVVRAIEETETRAPEAEEEKKCSEPMDGETEQNKALAELKIVAYRVASFFNDEGAMINDLKGFNKHLVMKNYGLICQERVEDEDEETKSLPNWIVDNASLSATSKANTSDGKEATEAIEVSEVLSELPSRKELLKRAKLVLVRATSAAAEDPSVPDAAEKTVEAEAKKSTRHGFCVLDQSNRGNVFFAELIRAITKLSLNKGAGPRQAKKLMPWALKEVDARVNELSASSASSASTVAPSDTDEAEASDLEDMKKIKAHLDLVKKTIFKHHRQGKNVLRVILGVDPLASKKDKEKDGLFPVLPKYGILPTTSISKKKGKTKEEKELERKKKAEEKEQEKKKKAEEKERKKQEKKQEKMEMKKKKKENSPPKKAKKGGTGEKDGETIKIQKESALGDVAINRALALGMEVTNDKDSNGDDVSDHLKLTAIETLLLSVIASQGLPVFGPHWEALIDPKLGYEGAAVSGDDFSINWYRMGGVILNAATVWETIARTNAETIRIELTHAKGPDVSALQTKYVHQEYDLRRKEDARIEAEQLRKDSFLLAKKSIMMLESLKQMMPPEIFASKNAKNDAAAKGLGAGVLQWCHNEICDWASALEVSDPDGSPFAAVKSDYLTGNPNASASVAAYFDGRACGTVFAQVAQQTRLRSLFIDGGIYHVTERLPHAIRNSTSKGDVWESPPKWWVCRPDHSGPMPCQDDMDLLGGILDYGYSGFDEMIKGTEAFRQRIEEDAHNYRKKGKHASPFTRATIQGRVNSLTRELHALEEGTSEDVARPAIGHKIVDGSPAAKRIQSGINSFFSVRPKPEAELICLDDSDEGDSSDQGTKRSGEAGSNGSAKKRPKSGH